MKRSATRRIQLVSAAAFILAIMLLSVAPALAISRSVVMARAQVWIDRAIPYGQTGWANEVGDIVNSPSLGWRRDCSGFTSMSWGLPKPGASTRTFHAYATAVTKESLQPGDALVSYSNHVLVFGGWADQQRVTYYAYEMSSSESSRTGGDGTVVRVTPYPYWSWPLDRPYIPYRLTGITGNIDYSPYITPVAGANRYATAIEASRKAFTSGEASAVVVASGVNWPDALGAAALAGAVNGPILLTSPASLSAGVATEIARIGAKEVIVVGGSAAVSNTVFAELAALPGVKATRIGGTTRYDTARLIAGETVRRIENAGETFDGTAFIATGLNFPDALAASSFAADAGHPILLTTPSSLSPAAGAALTEIGVSRALVLGGESALTSQIASDLATTVGAENVIRLGDSTRYSTASVITAFCLPESSLGYGSLAIATGQNYPDALAGGVMAAHMGTYLGLTPSGSLHPELAQTLLDHTEEVGSPHVLGGSSVILSIVRESIALALGGI
ncbi:MAG: cell wall-binding repeat-containing protein [Coriobacteriia bacterium]|nr:cell wall-binding repeat-containing protein [Coriobacteriia bacterium]